ncbi:MAG: Ig domain-containing protein [Acutalibacteraceae bacterium]
MKKAAIIISIVAVLLVLGTGALLCLNPEAAAQIAFWVKPTEPETQPTEPPTETQPQITELTLSGKSKLKKGDTAELAVKYSPQIAAVPKISWSSSDKNVASVDNEGCVKAVAKGECAITALADNGVRADFKLSVTDERMDKINILNNYLVELPDSRLEKYGKSSTMLVTLERAEIGDFNGDKSEELLLVRKSASGCEFAEIVALNSVDKPFEISNCSSYADVFEKNYDSYKESIYSGSDSVIIKSTAVSSDKSKKTRIREVTVTTYSSGGTSSKSTFKDVYKYKDADMKKLDKGEFTIDGQAYKEAEYLSKLSAVTNGCSEIVNSLNSRSETIPMGRFVKINTVCELDDVYLSQIEWKSDKPEIAKVNDSGVVTGVRSGSCVVTGTLKGMDSAVARVVINVRESSQALSSYLAEEKGKSIKGESGSILGYQGALTVDIDSDGTKELLLYYKSGTTVQIDVCEDKNGTIERISGAYSETKKSGDVELQLYINNATDKPVLSVSNHLYGSAESLEFSFCEYKDGRFESSGSVYKIVKGNKNSYYQDGNSITQAEFERQTGHYSKYMEFKAD